MDLDNIKKTWNNTEIKPSIADDKIQKMISNEGRSAFTSLLRYEKIGIAVLILCIPLGYFILLRHTPVLIFYTCSVVACLIWQVYKFRKLRKMDVAVMTITEVSCHFYWYRKAILKELTVAVIWFVFTVLLFGYFEMMDNDEIFRRNLLLFIVLMTLGLICILILFKYLYWNNIKKMEASIRELEEFERDNKE